MQYRITLVLAAVIVVTAGCTSTGSAPATAPPTTERVPTTTTTTPPRATSTTLAPTTTIDREAEIEAIFQDLEQRRLEAIRQQDVQVFSSLYANEAYLDQDMAAFLALDVNDGFFVSIEDFELQYISPECAAFAAVVDNSGAFVGGGTNLTHVVLERSGDEWGYSWIGEGWQCEGPHPLSS